MGGSISAATETGSSINSGKSGLTCSDDTYLIQKCSDRGMDNAQIWYLPRHIPSGDASTVTKNTPHSSRARGAKRRALEFI